MPVSPVGSWRSSSPHGSNRPSSSPGGCTHWKTDSARANIERAKNRPLDPGRGRILVVCSQLALAGSNLVLAREAALETHEGHHWILALDADVLLGRVVTDAAECGARILCEGSAEVIVVRQPMQQLVHDIGRE